PPHPHQPLTQLLPYTTLFRSERLTAQARARGPAPGPPGATRAGRPHKPHDAPEETMKRTNLVLAAVIALVGSALAGTALAQVPQDRKSTRLNSSHVAISYAVF